MTLSIFNYGGHSIDERLTIEDATIKQGPLESVARHLGRSVKDCATKIDHRTTQTTPAKPTNHRSIFPSYWKTDPRLSQPSHSPSRTPDEIQKRQQPQRRRIHNTYTYTYDRDPYHFFGIEEDGSKSSSAFYDGDSDSLNSYESVLQKNEVGVMEENCRRSRTCPSLFRAGAGMGGMGLNSMGMGKATQSDTILYAKKRSCLRKSRFSLDTANNDGTQPSELKIKGKSETSVSFESNVKVHLFQPPVENWAQSGWSNWYGNWQ